MAQTSERAEAGEQPRRVVAPVGTLGVDYRKQHHHESVTGFSFFLPSDEGCSAACGEQRERMERKREGLTQDRHGCVEGQAEHDGHGGRQPGGPGAQVLRGYLADEGPAELSDFAVICRDGSVSMARCHVQCER